MLNWRPPTFSPVVSDDVIARLEKPYDLIAEWSRHLPLSDVLGLKFLTAHFRHRYDEGTVELYLTRQGCIRDLVVSADLFRRTELSAVAFHREFGDEIDHGYWGRLFLRPTDCQPITETEYLQRLQRAKSP